MNAPKRALLAVAIAAVLGVVALAYLHPAVMIQLGEQIWACFG